MCYGMSHADVTIYKESNMFKALVNQYGLGAVVALILTLASFAGQAYAARVETPQNGKIWIDVDSGKQVPITEVYRNVDKQYYECSKKEIVFNGNTGKPSLKPVR